MRFEIFLIHFQVGPSKKDNIAKKTLFSKEDVNKSRTNVKTKITKQVITIVCIQLAFKVIEVSVTYSNELSSSAITPRT